MKAGVTALLVALFVASAFLVPSAVHAATNQVNLSSCISNGFSITYDSTNSLAYVAEGISTNKIAKIDLSTVMTGGCSSVTSFSSVFPISSGSVGNFAGGPFGLVLQGGDVWVSAVYNNGVGISEVSTSGTVLGTWYHATTGGASMGRMVGDGSKLYSSMPDSAILVFDPASDTFSTISTSNHAVYGLYLSGSTLDFTTQDSIGYGSVTTSGGSLSLGSLGSSATFVTQDGSGDLWITSNVSHDLYEVVSGVVSTFTTGMTSDGPYGVAAPSCSPLSGNVYVWGYANLNLARFTMSNSSIKTIATFTDKPYMGFIDSSCNLWGFALGSMVLFNLVSSSPSSRAPTWTGPTLEFPALHISQVSCSAFVNWCSSSRNLIVDMFGLPLTVSASADLRSWNWVTNITGATVVVHDPLWDSSYSVPVSTSCTKGNTTVGLSYDNVISSEWKEGAIQHCALYFSLRPFPDNAGMRKMGLFSEVDVTIYASGFDQNRQFFSGSQEFTYYVIG